MPRPGLLGGGDCAGLAIVVELGILAQAAPEAVLLAGIVGLVDQVALVGVGAVLLDEGLGGAVPGLGLEGAAVAQAERDGLAEGAEEGGLEQRVPGEAWAAVLAGARGPAAAPAGHREVLVGHGSESRRRRIVRRGRGRMRRPEWRWSCAWGSARRGCETEGIRALQAVHWSRAGLRTATGTPSRRGETALAMAMSRARHKTISKIIQGPYPGWTCRIGASSESGRAERMPFCHTGRWSRTSFARLGTCDGEAGTAPTSAVGTETDRLPGAITCPTRQGGWLNAG